MNNKKVAVVRITAKRKKKGIERQDGQVLESQDNYNLASNPFFRFLYEEIKSNRSQSKA